jgi:SAM-dependent methyltransferase
MIEMTDRNWPVLLFKKSVLKQRKFKRITELLGDTQDLDCLDIGSDNGVISYLLRKRGGRWKSADLDEAAIRSIHVLVKRDVFQIDGRRIPFDDNEFDRVVIIDFLEHIETDQEFIEELFRVIKPHGGLIINVPHIKNSLLRKFRHVIGETDEKHGHVRPGYTLETLTHLLRDRFTIDSCTTYSKFFCESIDTLLTFGYGRLKGGQSVSSKGLIVTGQDFTRYRKIFLFYSCVYPLLWLVAKLDELLFWTSGYMLIAKARVKK